MMKVKELIMMIKMKMIVLKKKVINIMKINVIIRIMTMMIVIMMMMMIEKLIGIGDYNGNEKNKKESIIKEDYKDCSNDNEKSKNDDYKENNY